MDKGATLRELHMQVTMKDIADDVGVSTATVSRVLNGKGPVSEEVKSAVLASVDRLGYRPNVIGRSLRLSRTFVIGVLIPDISNPFFGEMVRAIEDRALDAGYAVMTCSSGEDLVREQRYVEVMLDRSVDGVLVAVTDSFSSDLAPLIETETPIVLIDRILESMPLDSITIDNEGAAELAVSYLISRGYKRIGVVAGPERVSTATGRLAGCQRALAARGFPLSESYLFSGDYLEESGLAAGRELIRMQNPPDAVLVTNNLMTLGFFRAVVEAGWRVPHDLAIIGFDDSDWASLATPTLTVVDQSPYEMGARAVKLLLDRLRADGMVEPRRTTIPVRLIRRGSC